MVRKKYWLCIMMMVLWVTTVLNAQRESYQFRLYSFEEGLSHRNTFKIQQDPSGLIWMATFNGLNLFDGYRFQKYNSQTKHIPFDFISDMLITSDSLIWLTSDNQVAVFDLKTGETIHTFSSYEKSDENSRVRVSNHFFEVKQGEIGLTTYAENRRGVFLQTINEEYEITQQQYLEGKYDFRPVAVGEDVIYINGYENELLELDNSFAEQGGYQFDLRGSDRSSSRVIQLQYTPNGTLWALLENCQVYFRPAGSKVFKQHVLTERLRDKGSPTAFLVEDNGDVWIGANSGLWHYKASVNQLENYRERIKNLTKYDCMYRHIFQDSGGTIWVATDFGVVKVVKEDNLFTTYLSEGHENCSNGLCSTRGITEDENGKIYISYYNSIHTLDPVTNSLSPLFKKKNFFNFPYGLLYFKNALWTGNGRRIDLETLKVDTVFKEPSIDKGVVIVDREERLWFGFENRLYNYDLEKDSVGIFKDPLGVFDTLQEISYLYEGKTGAHLWIGTSTGGLYKMVKDSGCVQHLTADTALDIRISHNRINAILEDDHGNLWIATASGLDKYDLNNQKMTFYTQENGGLPNDFINGILLEGDSCVWVSTDNGLCRFSQKEAKCTNFFEEDGISNNEFNRISFYKARNGRFYFGGLNGVNAFFPGPVFSTKQRTEVGNLVLMNFSYLDGRSDSLVVWNRIGNKVKDVALTYRDKFFSISFALANYKNPRENQYSYKLEGFDPTWSEFSTINEARYHNIPAGDYIFRVRTTSGKGNSASNEIALPITIEQAYYKSPWFIIGGSLLAGLILFGVYQFRVYQIRRRERFLEREVSARTKELEMEKKKSDELLLNILPAETAEELKKFGYAKAKRYEEVTVLLSDFTGFTMIAEKLEPEALVDEIDFCFREFDLIMERNQLEKIKTIGDAYMCVGGIPSEEKPVAVRVVQAALEIQEFLEKVAQEKRGSKKPFFEARIGIHTGPVVAGIVGIKKFAYDIWGDTVNIAARMESQSKKGKVNISASTYEIVKDYFNCTYRGKVKAKNKGEIDMYFVEGGRRSNGTAV